MTESAAGCEDLARFTQEDSTAFNSRYCFELEVLALSIIGALLVYSPRAAGAFRERLQSMVSRRERRMNRATKAAQESGDAIQKAE